jgi:hypothetical protein
MDCVMTDHLARRNAPLMIERRRHPDPAYLICPRCGLRIEVRLPSLADGLVAEPTGAEPACALSLPS